MTRSEAYSARAGYVLLAAAALAVVLWRLNGGSSDVPVALVCLVGAMTSFLVAWRSSWDDDGVHTVFPIADYDDLWVSEILPMLHELDSDELVDVFRYERSRAARPSILQEIETLLAG